jgi:hypothetical protein
MRVALSGDVRECSMPPGLLPGRRRIDGCAGVGSVEEQTMPVVEIEDRIVRMEQRLRQLKARKVRVDARIRHLQAKQVRRDDTRRKILVGAVVLAKVEQGVLEESTLRSWLDGALSRADDRRLFDALDGE